MPVKKVTCSTCKEEVSKRQTYLVDEKTGKRACKKHAETVEKKKQIDTARQVAQIEKKKAEEHRIREKRAHQMGTPEFDQRSKEVRKCCWKCLRQGLRHKEWHLRYLVALEKATKKKGQPVFPLPLNEEGIEDVKRVQEAMGSPYKDREHVLYLGQWKLTPERVDKVLPQIRKRFREIAWNPLVPLVQLCLECAEKIGYKYEDQFEERPEPTSEQIKNQMIFGMMMHKQMQPGLERQAEIELDVEHENKVRRN